LTRLTSYPEGTNHIVHSLKEILDISERVVLINKVEQAFGKVANGLLRNSTINSAGIITMVNEYMGEYVEAKTVAGEKPEKEKKTKLLKEIGLNQKNVVAKMTHLQQHRYLLSPAS